MDEKSGVKLGDQRKTADSAHFLAHVSCCQTAGWIRIPIGTQVGLGSGGIVLDGELAVPHGKGHSSPHFSVHGYCDLTVAHLSNC